MAKEITEEQWAWIRREGEKCLESQTEVVPDEDIRQAVNDMWASMGKVPEEISIVDSPKAGSDLYKSREANPDMSALRNSSYVSIFWRRWACFYRCGKYLGAEYDSRYELFQRWCRCVGHIYAFERRPIVSRNPTQVHWRDGELHNESGKAVEYADGWGLYAITGVRVPEKVVMAPETQTLGEIRGEENAEVKRIRIERFGWERYLNETNAEVIHTRRNDVEATLESLMRTDDMTVLVGACPSTGRIYAMEVDAECSTCEEAQKWLTGGEKFNMIGAS